MPPQPTPHPVFGPVLLVGAGGMLGRAWAGLLAAHAVEHRRLDLPEFDLCRAGDAARILDRGGYTHAINCAGWTDVDAAEHDEPAARRVNAEGVAALARECARSSCTLIHFSTDYVFDGSDPVPYPTDAPTCPINAYGRTKALGEQAVLDSGADALIVRTSWLYAPWGKNFVRTIARLAAERDELRVVDDQRGRPSNAEFVARNTLALALLGARGIHHVTDAGVCTWFDLASEVVRCLRSPCRVLPCTSAEHPRPARRPPNSVLELGETERLIGPMIPWELALAGVCRRLLPDPERRP